MTKVFKVGMGLAIVSILGSIIAAQVTTNDLIVGFGVVVGICIFVGTMVLNPIFH